MGQKLSATPAIKHSNTAGEFLFKVICVVCPRKIYVNVQKDTWCKLCVLFHCDWVLP